MNEKSFWDYIKNLYKGRINRKNYFLGFLFAILTIWLVVAIVENLFYDSYYGEPTLFGGIISIVAGIVYIIFILSLHVRRFHDKGESGWRVFLFLVPLLNLIIILTLFFEKGQEEANKYGENPLKTNRGFWDIIFNKTFEPQMATENNSLSTGNHKYCHKCGNCLEINSKFCTKCGTKLQS